MTTTQAPVGRGHGGLGTALRAERERRRISLEAVARDTLVRIDFLELIDDDRLEELPKGAYGKGFIRSYAAHLGLDPQPFLEGYDRRCGRPAPELSKVVRRGVRVPPAAQPRARRIAVTVAITALALLAYFGAFRSGDSPSEANGTTPATERVRAGASAPSTMGAVLRVDVTTDETWIEATVDDQPVFAETVPAGESRTFRGEQSVTIFIARAHTVELTANGKLLGAAEAGGYRGTFTMRTQELPPNELDEPEDGSEQVEIVAEEGPEAAPAS
jgi:cytoskeleton protein RodZ